ncbi:MAG: BON domain-containing protein [Acidobacteria bacterium]|nr:BON domain-containing protein [Acidobacteriota bacterium]
MITMPRSVVRTCVALTFVAATAVAFPTGAAFAEAQTPDQLQKRVEDAIHDERAWRNLEVTVAGDEATLTGRLNHFWDKHRAIQRALSVNGISFVASEIVIPVEEDQQKLAEEVGRQVQRYPHYTMWDVIDGRLDNGAVTLFGSVTPERDKSGELFERIAKIRGVQDVQVNFDVLPPSTSDDRLRYAIARQVFRSPHFERFGTMTNPPFHIIVDNGVVTLVGYVPSQIELLELQRIVAQTQGVLRVENQLQTQ